jgi:hypothetical protein
VDSGGCSFTSAAMNRDLVFIFLLFTFMSLNSASSKEQSPSVTSLDDRLNVHSPDLHDHLRHCNRVEIRALLHSITEDINVREHFMYPSAA